MHKIHSRLLLIGLLFGLISSLEQLRGVPASGQSIMVESEVTLEGEIQKSDDLSGAALTGELLLIGSDEGTQLQVLRRTDAKSYRSHSVIELMPPESDEIDIEAVAISGDQVYVAGSHAWVRKKIEYPDDEDNRSYAKNRERLAEIKTETSRNRIVRFTMSATGGRQSAIESINLRALLANDVYLARFLNIPAKEGGIDIEGLAADGDTLYVGFRGPVLRQNYVPVMKFHFEQPRQYELLFVNLAGQGIRDLLKVEGGMLVLAGPVGDADGDYQLYFWNGTDCLPGSDKRPAQLDHLGEVESPKKAKPEAIALLDSSPEAWTLLVLCDGAENGAPRRLRVKKP